MPKQTLRPFSVQMRTADTFRQWTVLAASSVQALINAWDAAGSDGGAHITVRPLPSRSA